MKKIYQFFFAKSCLSSVFGPFYGAFQHQTSVSRDFGIFVVRGAYLGHFAIGKFRQIAEISGGRNFVSPYRVKKSSSRVSYSPQKSLFFDAISKNQREISNWLIFCFPSQQLFNLGGGHQCKCFFDFYFRNVIFEKKHFPLIKGG